MIPFRTLTRLALATLVAVFMAVSAPHDVDAAGLSVLIRTAAGRAVSALLTEAVQVPAAAVVLVPMLGRPKEDWQPMADRLASANITSLAIDLPASLAPADPKVLAGWADDVRTALGYLEARPELQTRSLGVVGASLGASLAATAAAGDGRVTSLVLVSPALEYRGLRIEGAMRAYGARPALLVASQLDPYAARSTRELAKDPPGLREVLWSDQSAHGTVLLAREPDLAQAIVDWFRRTLP